MATFTSKDWLHIAADAATCNPKYAYAKLVVAPRKQGTRMLKACCPVDGYNVRLARTWAMRALPECPLCGTLLHCDAINPDAPREGSYGNV